MNNKLLLQVLLLLLTFTVAVVAQLDDRLVGRWKSSSGAIVDIKHPRVGDGSYTKMTINGRTNLDAIVEYGDMDSLILTYTSSGSEMKAYFDPQTRIITVYDGDKEFATWTKQ